MRRFIQFVTGLFRMPTLAETLARQLAEAELNRALFALRREEAAAHETLYEKRVARLKFEIGQSVGGM